MSDNLRSRQLNPCDHLFWKCRGYPERPYNWQEILENMGYYDSDDQSDESEYEEYSESETDSYEDEESEEEYEENCLKSNQNNPNNDEYWRLRGWSQRPDDWRERINGNLPQYKPQNQPKRSAPKKINEWWKYGKNVL